MVHLLLLLTFQASKCPLLAIPCKQAVFMTSAFMQAILPSSKLTLEIANSFMLCPLCFSLL